MHKILHSCVVFACVADAQLWAGGDWPAFGRSSTFNSFSAAPLPDKSIKEWTHTGQSRFVASPAVANKTVYLGSDGGYLLALDQDTGVLRWSFEVPAGNVTGDHCGTRANCVRSSPSVLKDGGVVFGSYDSYVYRLNNDGKLLWKVRGALSFAFRHARGNDSHNTSNATVQD